MVNTADYCMPEYMCATEHIGIRGRHCTDINSYMYTHTPVYDRQVLHYSFGWDGNITFQHPHKRRRSE